MSFHCLQWLPTISVSHPGTWNDISFCQGSSSACPSCLEDCVLGPFLVSLVNQQLAVWHRVSAPTYAPRQKVWLFSFDLSLQVESSKLAFSSLNRLKSIQPLSDIYFLPKSLWRSIQPFMFPYENQFLPAIWDLQLTPPTSLTIDDALVYAV